MFSRILVALDGSPIAEKALAYAEGLGKDADTVLVQVIPTITALMSPSEAEAAAAVDDLEETLEVIRREADSYLARLGSRLEAKGLQVSHQVPEGDAAVAIQELARGLKIDLIIITTHGRTGLGRVLFGSVAEGVLRRSPCPVLVIPVHDE